MSQIAEAIVERYLTANGLAKSGITFVCPQFELSCDKWIANFDFLVLDFERREERPRVIIVEVSDSGGPGSVDTKARAFAQSEYRDRLREKLHLQIGDPVASEIYFLGFVRTEPWQRRQDNP